MNNSEMSSIKYVSFESLKIPKELSKSFRESMKKHMYFVTDSAKFLTLTGDVFVHYQNNSVTTKKEGLWTTQDYF